MNRQRLNHPRYVTTPILVGVSDLYYPDSMSADDGPLEQFAGLIRETRETFGWTQDDLAEASGVSRPTINRYEQGKTRTPEPETARAIFRALRLDPRRIPVILGYVTAEEMGLPVEAPRSFAPTTEEVIAILEDPRVDPQVRAEWIAFLHYRAQGGTPPAGRRAAG